MSNHKSVGIKQFDCGWNRMRQKLKRSVCLWYVFSHSVYSFFPSKVLYAEECKAGTRSDLGLDWEVRIYFIFIHLASLSFFHLSCFSLFTFCIFSSLLSFVLWKWQRNLKKPWKLMRDFYSEYAFFYFHLNQKFITRNWSLECNNNDLYPVIMHSW